MIVIGITGSIGMGKSTAAEMLRDLGIPVHDSDATIHWFLAAKGKGVAAVGEKFPEALKTNADGDQYIDRHILGKIVFADRHRKKELEDILHPLVWAESQRFIDEMKQKGHEIVALDIPLLFETGGEKRVDVTLCVSAPKEIQKERVLARPGMTSEKFDKIVAGQMSDAEKRKQADYVIETGKDFEDVRKQLTVVVEKIRVEKIRPPKM
ncbi:MAG: dephospho-CoA kinase [Proteobacteria bacterium]|nr:dephospho-CoA kinase [Pseudomonadota bacterium]